MATKVYRVIVRGDLAKRGRGSRRRLGIDFSRSPTYLADPAPEIEADPFFEVEAVEPKEWAKLEKSGAKLRELPSPEPAEPAPPAAKPKGSSPASPAAQEAEADRIREAISGVGPKTSRKLLAAGFGLSDTRVWGDLRRAGRSQLEQAGLGPAEIKAVESWQAVEARRAAQPKPHLSQVEAQLKAERIQ